MPPVTMFKKQGTLDEYEGELKGKEFFRMMKYFSNKALLFFTIFFAVLAGVMPLFMNIFMGDMVNIMADGTDFMNRFKPIIYKLIGFTIGQFLVMGINMQLRFTSNPSFMRDMRRNLFHAFLEKDIEYYDRVPTGIMVGRISQDVTLVHEIFIDKMCTALQMLAQSFGGVILSFVVMWHAALIGVGTLSIAGIIYVINDETVNKIWIEYNENASAAASKAE